ncbi:hypothetical protein JOC69_000671 [Heliobacterium gestii]|nr:hypothetical protein [Heliomicrobium gestii]
MEEITEWMKSMISDTVHPRHMDHLHIRAIARTVTAVNLREWSESIGTHIQRECYGNEVFPLEVH